MKFPHVIALATYRKVEQGFKKLSNLPKHVTFYTDKPLARPEKACNTLTSVV